MQLYLVRHGESQNNAGQSNRHNVPLTPRGHQQIHRAAQALQGIGFEALYCSPLDRALQSAAILAEGLRLSPYVHPLFAEVGFCWGEPDRPRSELETLYPQAQFDPRVTEEGWAPASGESEEEAYERATRMIQWLWERHPEPESRVLLVSHGHFGSLLIGSVAKAPPCGYARFSQNNAGISCVELREEWFKVRFLNRTAHLPEAMLT